MAADRIRTRTISAAAWGVLLLCLWLWSRGLGEDAQDNAGAQNAFTAAQVLQGPAPKAAKPLNPAGPQGVEVKSIGVQAVVSKRGLDKSGAVDPPPFGSANEVGWYQGGATPGAAGAAIMVGHVDTRSKPAVFYRLHDIRPGEKIRVNRADGTAAVFTVERVETFDKESFNADRVYGPHKKGRAELRLITCGGEYQPLEKAYTGNLVVSAYLTGTSP
ncbi:class F sortase [Streptomyces sp. A7024]|uniref:Class F sortase n=1 Tax=Streptomyces coryli TaxID=1128680 RepID=A0A6G4U6S3_9ACTN|nr:class F sortase [Streptomyces coryli]